MGRELGWNRKPMMCICGLSPASGTWLFLRASRALKKGIVIGMLTEDGAAVHSEDGVESDGLRLLCERLK